LSTSPTIPAIASAAQANTVPEPSRTSQSEHGSKQSAVKYVRGASTSSEAAVTAQTQAQPSGVALSGTTTGTSIPTATTVATGNNSTSSGGSSTAGDQSSTDKTFAALDAGTPTSTPTWVSTGANQAEAGYKDPELGWVGVQAKSSGGAVHASIVAGSNNAADALSGQLEGLNTFLAAHRTPVESLTVAAPDGRSSGLGMDHGTSQQMNQGQGQGTGQGTGQEISQNLGASTGQGSGQGAPTEQYFAPQAIATASTTADSSTIDGSGTTGGSTASAATIADGNGVHISVMA
jgi:hypothetical protein